jgi:hypothetical protein
MKSRRSVWIFSKQEQLGDQRELLKRFGLELRFHLGERKSVVLFLFLDRARARRSMPSSSSSSADSFLNVFLFLVGRAGGRFGDLAVGPRRPRSGFPAAAP